MAFSTNEKKYSKDKSIFSTIFSFLGFNPHFIRLFYKPGPSPRFPFSFNKSSFSPIFALLFAIVPQIFPIFGPLAKAQGLLPHVFYEDVAENLGIIHDRPLRLSFIHATDDIWPDIQIGGQDIFVSTRLPGGRRFIHYPKMIPSFFNSDKSRWSPSVTLSADLDNDGLFDLILLDNYEYSANIHGPGHKILLKSDDGYFLPVKKTGLELPKGETTIAAALLDINRDGSLDLFIGNTYIKYGNLEAMGDRLMMGNGDGTFEKSPYEGMAEKEEPGEPDSARPTFGVAVCDWDNNGSLDIFTCSYGRQYNRLWSLEGDKLVDMAPFVGFDGDEIRHGIYPPETVKIFKETRNIDMSPEPAFRSNGNTFSIALGDYDNDGDMDAFVGEIFHSWAGESSDLSCLLENTGAFDDWKFKRRPDAIKRVIPQNSYNVGDLHVAWTDCNNDGLLDLLIGQSDYPDDHRLRLFIQYPAGIFTEITESAGLDWMGCGSISICDFDRDGDEDILLGRSHMRLTKEQKERYPLKPGLYKNMTGNKNSWIGLRLEDEKGGNRSAIGARVWIFADGLMQMKDIRAGEGHAGHQNPPDLHFGLGKARSVDYLIIRWPDSSFTIERHQDLRARNFYHIKKGHAPIPLGR